MTRHTQQIARWRVWPQTAVVLLLVGAAGLACDKMPLVAPTGTTITLYASSTGVGLNGSVDLTATVIESAGTAVQNGTVVTFTTTLGSVDPAEARTQNGKVTVKLLSGTRSGVAEVRALSGGASTKDALKINVGAAAAAKVDLIATPSALSSAGGTVQLTATVSDANGNRLEGVPVSFTTDAGIMSQSSVPSDANGEARASLVTASEAKVTATVVGGTGSTSTLTATLTVPVRATPNVTLTPPFNAVEGTPVTFVVSITAVTGTSVRTAVIDFGDGGTQNVSTSGTSSASHVYDRSGTFVVKVSATDAAGESATATTSIVVQEVSVVVGLTASPVSPVVGATVTFIPSAVISPTGTSLVIVRYEWTFGDGTTGVTSTAAAFHSYATRGVKTITVRAVASNGRAGTAAITIEVL
ncbi:MAG: PKD domain-containing protein [Acidobacteriota bacterium]